ncbi:Rop family plasmid primer RNA-binding protein (plasmid) [Escherichia coli]|uniref:Rop family plasmid primer RNA-binding protein n=1 Tax=Escherichia coli TaxID=562 RepID=A0A5B9AVY9_ECOLX|nr:Rop family plasmid primer RNA-binding protein [Escherichia coli]
MNKQQKTAVNMAKFIRDQSLLLLDRLNELDLDHHEADFCEKLHEDAERLYRSLSARLNEQQDGA